MDPITSALLAWYDRCARVLPWRGFHDAYRTWVSEAMLQQTRVETVLSYYPRFLSRFPSLASLASAPEADILKVHEGQKCTVKTTATGDEEFAATVSRVVNIYSPGQMNMMGQTTGGGYSAEITIDDKNTDLLIGMTAKVQILLEEKKTSSNDNPVSFRNNILS